MSDMHEFIAQQTNDSSENPRYQNSIFLSGTDDNQKEKTSSAKENDGCCSQMYVHYVHAAPKHKQDKHKET